MKKETGIEEEIFLITNSVRSLFCVYTIVFSSFINNNLFILICPNNEKNTKK